MADSSKLALAAYLIRDAVQLRITKLDWPEKLGFSVFDFEASIALAGKRFSGRGVHSDESIALDKAISESFERSLECLTPDQIDFGGLAVHTDLQEAAEAAQLELIERDSFFCHFLTSTPFQKSNLIMDSDIGRRLVLVGREFGISVKDSILSTPRGIFASAVFVFGQHSVKRSFGVRIGLGCSRTSQEAALEKAVLEVLPMFSFATLGAPPEVAAPHELLAIGKPGPEDHIKWAHHPSSADAMADCLSNESSCPVAEPLDKDLIVTEQIHSPSAWPSVMPLVAVGARHPTAVRSFFGGNQIAPLFKERLERFSGRSFEKLNLPQLPHPLG